MLNLKYAFQGLSKKITFTLLAILQLTCSFVLLYYCITLNDSLQENNNKVLNIFNNKILYTLQNKEDYWEDLYKNNNEDKYLKFRNYLKNSKDFTHISYSASYILVKDFKNCNEFKANPYTVMDKHNNTYNALNCLSIDENFLKHFPLTVSNGSLFNINSFNCNKENDPIPVILGSNYNGIFTLGDTIDYTNKKNNTIKKLKVVGFLDSKQYFTCPSLPISSLICLDNFIIFPQQQIEKLYSKDIATMDNYNASYKMDLYNNIMESVIIINDIKKEADITNEIVEKAKLSGFYDIETLNSSKELDRFLNMYKEQNLVIFVLFLIVFCVCSIGIISNMLYSISKRFKEFGVHILNGASIYDIALRIFYEVVLLMGFSTVFSVISINLLKSVTNISFQFNPFIKLIILILILTLIISLPPIIYVLKNQTEELLRRQE